MAQNQNLIAFESNITAANSTVLAYSGSVSSANNIQSSNGFYSVGAFNGTYTDGIVVDYTTTNGRISVGSADTLSFYTGGVANTVLFSANTTGIFTAGGANVGYLELPQNSQTAAYTTVMSDSGKSIVHPSTDNNARTITIANNSSVAYALGTTLTFINMANVMTIAINNDTLYLSSNGATGSRSLNTYGIATAIKVGTTSWVISGSNLT